MGLIYKITVNNKNYIGKTEYSIDKRINKHLHNAKNNHQGYFYNSLRKNNFKFIYTILEDGIYKNINDREKYWIKYYDTFLGDGYNMTEGGDGGNTYKNILDPDKTCHYRRNNTTIINTNGDYEEICILDYDKTKHKHISKDKITVRDKSNNTKRVSLEEYRSSSDLEHHSKGFLTCINEYNERVRVTCEEYKNNDKLIYVQTGKKYSQEYKDKMSMTKAKYYYTIYNSNDELICEGKVLKKLCAEFNLPFNTFKANSLKEDRLYQNTSKIALSRLINNGNIKYLYWNCVRNKF